MKKKLLIAVVLAAVVAIPVFAFAQTNNQPQNERRLQMQQRHEQMIENAVSNGTITADEASILRQAAPIMQKIMQNGGMMKGKGMMGGGMGKGACPYNETQNNQ